MRRLRLFVPFSQSSASCIKVFPALNNETEMILSEVFLASGVSGRSAYYASNVISCGNVLASLRLFLSVAAAAFFASFLATAIPLIPALRRQLSTFGRLPQRALKSACPFCLPDGL